MATPEFVTRLREKIGNDPLLLPGVTAVVMRPPQQEDPIWALPEVLLVKRSDNGQWTPVTGIIDPGEQAHQAAVREVKEETGLTVQPAALLGVGAVGPVTYDNGDVCYYHDTSLRMEVVEGTDPTPIVGDDESTEVKWVVINQLPAIAPRFRMVIADAAAQMKHPPGFVPRMGFTKRSEMTY
ncbi:NUDIX domain-containing protein [Corynebacterium choanae]|nr:NUDIX domain-containing protein [Corynebacterium choanae]